MKKILSKLSLLGFFSVFTLYVQRAYFSQSIFVIPAAANWTQLEQGYLQGFFYFGYLLIQILAGRLCKMIGSHTLAVASLLGTTICFSLIPEVAERLPLSVLIFLRMVMGMAQGALYPAIVTAIGAEFSSVENSSIINFVFSGGQAGSIFILLFSPLLSKAFSSALHKQGAVFFAAWQLQFYSLGVLGLVVIFFWLFFVQRSSKRSRVRAHDMDQIDSEQELPWCFLFSQKPFWAYVGSYAAHNWFMTIAIPFLPKFLCFILGFGTELQQVFSSVFYFGFWVFSVLTGVFTDYLICRQMPLLLVRRRIGTSSHFLCAFLFFVLGSAVEYQKYPYLSFTILALAITVSGACKSAFAPNVFDLAHSMVNRGKITGAAFFGVSLVGITSPVFTSILFQLGLCTDSANEPLSCHMAWRAIFIISAAINIFSALIWNYWLSVSPLHIKGST